MEKGHRFDPLSLIYSENDEHSDSSAQTFDTIADVERHLLKNEPEIVDLLKDEETRLHENIVEQASTSSSSKALETSSAANPSVSLINSKPKPSLVAVKKKVARTVLTKLENCEYVGPLSLLCRCVHEKLKIRVSIRSRTKIRSQLTCYLTAFDNHWNLAVTDVDELYYKKTGVSIFRQNSKQNPNTVCTDVPRSLYYVSVNKKLSNYELVRRHVPQMFVKGDNIVLISIIR